MSRNAEAKIQAAIVEWVRTVAPDILIFSIPNGGLRTKAEAALFKWTGATAGIPDLALIIGDGRACFVEVKTPEGRVSPEQREIMQRLESLGASCIVARSIDDVRAAFAEWAIPTREVVNG